MLLYNITIGIDHDIEAESIEWMNTVHIPQVMATQLFVSYKFLRVLSVEEGDNPSFCIQYVIPSIEQFQIYLNHHAANLMEAHRVKYGDKHVALRTLLEEI